MLGRICKLLGFDKSYFGTAGVKWASGTTVPSDTTAGYAKGCLFIDTDASDGSVIFVNVGSITSCDFDSIE